MADRAYLEAPLRRLRQQVGEFGLRRTGDHRSWDEVVDLYDGAVEEAAAATDIAVPSGRAVSCSVEAIDLLPTTGRQPIDSVRHPQ